MWVRDRTKKTGSFKSHPAKALKNTEEHIRCTKPSEIAFTDDGTIIHACRYHAPEDLLDDLNIPLPKDRRREGRIQV